MKKFIISVMTIGISVLLFCGISIAREIKTITALDERFIININDSDMPWFVSMVTIQGYSYVNLRSFCEIFGINVDWDSEEGKILLETPPATPDEFDFALSEEAALKYGEAIFQDIFIQEYLDEMKIFIPDEGEYIKPILEIMTEKIADPTEYYFCICMPKERYSGDGREFAAVIKKSDGRIIEVLQIH